MSSANTIVLAELARAGNRPRSARELATVCELSRDAVDDALAELGALGVVIRELVLEQPLRAMWCRVGRERHAA